MDGVRPRQLHIELILESLAELGSDLFQRQVWMAQVEGVCASSIECFCRLFDDSGLGDALEEDVEAFGGEIDNTLREILRLMISIGDAIYEPELFAEAAFQRMSLLASDILPFVMLRAPELPRGGLLAGFPFELCPVCGYEPATFPWGRFGLPASGEECDCCGVEWGGGDNIERRRRAFREGWLADGAHWSNPNVETDGLTTQERLARLPGWDLVPPEEES